MAENDVQDFIELRVGFQGMADFSAAALRFLDRFGIASKAIRPSSNGASSNGVTTFREKVKKHYKKRRQHYSHPGGYSDKVLEQRRASLRVLDALDPDEPRQVIAEGKRSMGSLVRRGYARKAGKGLYTRTSKPYSINKMGSDTASSPSYLTVSQAAKRLKISESFVRILINQKKLSSSKEVVPVKGKKPQRLMVLDPDDVSRYAAAAK